MLAALPTFLFPSWKGMHAYSAGLHGVYEYTASLGSGNHGLRNVGLHLHGSMDRHLFVTWLLMNLKEF
jgi:hypothetical protein